MHRCTRRLALLAAIGLPLIVRPALAQDSRTPARQDSDNIADLVTANHILADQGVVDGFCHDSVRSVQKPNHYFISRSKAPALVTEDDQAE